MQAWAPTGKWCHGFVLLCSKRAKQQLDPNSRLDLDDARRTLYAGVVQEQETPSERVEAMLPRQDLGFFPTWAFWFGPNSPISSKAKVIGAVSFSLLSGILFAWLGRRFFGSESYLTGFLTVLWAVLCQGLIERILRRRFVSVVD